MEVFKQRQKKIQSHMIWAPSNFSYTWIVLGAANVLLNDDKQDLLLYYTYLIKIETW